MPVARLERDRGGRDQAVSERIGPGQSPPASTVRRRGQLSQRQQALLPPGKVGFGRVGLGKGGLGQVGLGRARSGLSR
jgi:hypothetical protein